MRKKTIIASLVLVLVAIVAITVVCCSRSGKKSRKNILVLSGEESTDFVENETTVELPTTEALTTEAPTTETPTTEAPTTEAPTTEAPTTEAPTTEAPTTAAPTTEAPTETPDIDYANVDWIAILEQAICAGNVDDIDWDDACEIVFFNDNPNEEEIEIMMNTFKQADNFDSIDWTAKSDFDPLGDSVGSVVVTTTRPSVVITPTSQPLTMEQKLEIDEFADENGEYKINGTIYMARFYRDEVMALKNQWIKDNFGTSFEHNGIKFGWNEERKAYYWVEKYGTIHYMTSISTSRSEYFCRNSYSYRIADYLGFYGTDSPRYHSEDSLNDDMFLWFGDENTKTVDDAYENNMRILKENGWIEIFDEEDLSRDWNIESPEGVPVTVYSDSGYLSVYIRYPEDEREKSYQFTIEELNELLKNNTWRVGSRSGARGFEFEPQEDWQKYIKKYLIIE